VNGGSVKGEALRAAARPLTFAGTMQIEMRQQALDHIRIAPDRGEAFAEVVKGIDMALERSRGLLR